jgi:hypothetical protein
MKGRQHRAWAAHLAADDELLLLRAAAKAQGVDLVVGLPVGRRIAAQVQVPGRREQRAEALRTQAHPCCQLRDSRAATLAPVTACTGVLSAHACQLQHSQAPLRKLPQPGHPWQSARSTCLSAPWPAESIHARRRAGRARAVTRRSSGAHPASAPGRAATAAPGQPRDRLQPAAGAVAPPAARGSSHHFQTCTTVSLRRRTPLSSTSCARVEG